MVHGKIFEADLTAAVMAGAGRCFLLPPSGVTQSPGLLPLSPDERVIYPEAEKIIHLLSVLQEEVVELPRPGTVNLQCR